MIHFLQHQKTIKNDLIQKLRNENSTLLNRAGQPENRLNLLENVFINNEIKLNDADQYKRRNITEIHDLSQSIKGKGLEAKVCKVSLLLEEVNVKPTKSNIEACHRIGDGTKTIVRFFYRKH